MRTTAFALFAVAALGCSAAEQRTPTAAVDEADNTAGAPMTPDEMSSALIVKPLVEPEPIDRTPVVIPGLEDQWSDDVKTLEVGRGTLVRSDPFEDAEMIGVVVRGTRVRWRAHVISGDCETAWIELIPRGWICAPVSPSTEPPSTFTLPRIGKRNTPGVVGRVRRSGTIYKNKKALRAEDGRKPDGDVVALSKTVHIDGVEYWRTKRGQYVEPKYVSRYWGSSWGGVELGEETGLSLPLAFAVSTDKRGRGTVPVRKAPAPRAKTVRKLKRRAPVSVLERSGDGNYIRIGDDEWVDSRQLRVAETSAPPSETVAGERWVDVDLENQVVVAYEGQVPVYATLVSTGTYRHRTPTGVFRINRKKSMTTMTSARDSREVYSVANVPYTMYFHQGYALHGAYWHDGFGRPHSHGCVNLSPTDAKWIYEFLGPEMPSGWSQMVADADHPGSAVRVRDADDPTPEFRGYAAEMEGITPDDDSDPGAEDGQRIASR